MHEYIGLRVNQAIQKIESMGYKYIICACDSDKLKCWDSEIVVKATRQNDTVELVTARFYMNVEGDCESNF